MGSCRRAKRKSPPSDSAVKSEPPSRNAVQKREIEEQLRTSMNTRPFLFRVFVALALFVARSPGETATTAPAAEATPRVREPAVAGLFYPKDPAELSRTIDACLAQAHSEMTGNLKAIITPHAGYTYSGPVAANAYHLLAGRTYKTVVLMGPSHYALLSAASVSSADVYRTPLGDVPVSPKAQALGKLKPFETNAHASVQRPSWWKQSSRPAPAPGEENAETWEHSLEVEVPFLQKTLGTFSLVPVVVGEVDSSRAAPALEKILDADTLIVASSDLSHYHPYAEAQKLDRRCLDAILKLDTAAMATQEACGLYPILTLLQVAKDRGWKPQLLDLRNSGDIAGDKSSVVGYAAVAFYDNAPAPKAMAAGNGAASDTYSVDERRTLLKLARESVRAAAGHRAPEKPSKDTITAKLEQPRGTFITLTKNGDLRGCIGHLGAIEPLYQDVLDNAHAAAVEDPRFPPVNVAEVDRLQIEISVLTPPQPLAFSSPEDLLKKLHPHQDGVVLKIGNRTATYLPQVWEQLPDKIEFLNTLSEKAGCAPNAWRGPDTSVSIYHVVSFSEKDERT